MKEDVAQRDHHIKELESVLASKGDDLAAEVNELTKVNMKLQRTIQAKQVFSEKLMKENKKLSEMVSQHDELPIVRNQRSKVISRDVPDGQAAEEKANVSCHIEVFVAVLSVVTQSKAGKLGLALYIIGNSHYTLNFDVIKPGKQNPSVQLERAS